MSNSSEKIKSLPRKISMAVSEPVREFSQTKTYSAYDYEMDKFTGLTTFHGLVRFYNAKPLAKLFWISILLVAMALFIMQVVKLFLILYNQPTVSEVRLEIPENGVQFPSTTICNYNPVKINYINDTYDRVHDLTDEVLEYILLTYIQVENLHNEYNRSKIQSMHSAYEKFLQRHPTFNLPQFFTDSGYKCKDMFLECTFGGQQFNCCDFARPILTDMGLCYQFHQFSNVSWRNRQFISGSFYGLQFIISIGKWEYPDAFINNFYENGIRFYVHSRGILPFLSSGGTSVSPGYRIYARLNPQHYILLAKNQWGKCKLSWEEDEEHPAAETYSSSNCEAHCVARAFYDRCNCTPLQYKLYDAYPTCNALDLYNCIEAEKFQVENSMYWYRNCPNCVIECDRWDYSLESSYSVIPNYGAGQFLKKRFNKTFHNDLARLKGSLLIVNIFLKEISYMEFEQLKATGPTETLSDIGGNMGLFIGASIVTLAEISVFLGKVCWSSCSKKRRHKVVRKLSPGGPSTPSSLATASTTASLKDLDPEPLTPFPCDPRTEEQESGDNFPAKVRFEYDKS